MEAIEPMTQCTRCPACDGDQIDESIDSIDGLCRDCGFAVHDGSDPPAMDWHIDEGDDVDSERDDWATEYKVRDATEQRIAQAFDELEETSDRLNLGTGIRDEAADIYCDAFRTKVTDGRKTACLIAACLRIAAIEMNEPIPAGRLTEQSEIDEKKFYLSQTAIEDELQYQLPVKQPSDYLPFLSTALDLTEEDLRRTEDELKNVAGDPAFIGKDPAAIAAAGVYVALDTYTQSEVANAAGTSTETIRLRVNQLRG